MTQKPRLALSLTFLASLLLAVSAWAAGPKSYQVTGEVTDVSDSTITVQKGKEKFEIARDASSKMTGTVEKGSKVTVYYTMKADEIEAKAAKKKK